MKSNPSLHKLRRVDSTTTLAKDLQSNLRQQHPSSNSILLAKYLVTIALSLLLLSVARVLCCPVPLSPTGMSFVKWALGVAFCVLCGAGITHRSHS